MLGLDGNESGGVNKAPSCPDVALRLEAAGQGNLRAAVCRRGWGRRPACSADGGGEGSGSPDPLGRLRRGLWTSNRGGPLSFVGTSLQNL